MAVLHREEVKGPGLHGYYTEYASTPEDACLLGYSEYQQRVFLFVGAEGHEASFWRPDHLLNKSRRRSIRRGGTT